MTTLSVKQPYTANRPARQNWLARQLQRLALHRAIDRVYPAFARQYPDWVDYAFDKWFLTHQALPLFTRTLEQHTWPTAAELVNLWAEQFPWLKDETHQEHKAALMPVAVDLLGRLAVEVGEKVG